jgi:pimeloyl-ACP methyl ester carboxylesterase
LDDELCAEHSGEIASFKALGSKLTGLEDFRELFERDSVNLLRAAKTAGAIIAGAAVFTPIAFVAAPALAASMGAAGLLGAAGTGTAISSLSGAALSSASLAAIGGGTMAAGAVVVTAAGSALGGYYGGAISNSFFGQVSNFDIRKLQDGTKHAVVVVNGFLSAESEETEDWEDHLSNYFGRNSWYHLDWEAHNLSKLGSKLVSAPKTAGLEFAKALAKRALKSAPRKVGPLSLLSTVADAISNPWHSTMVKAQMSGVMLADAIARTPGWRFTLVGHSLGARVVYYALEALSTQRRKRIENVYLLGGAVGRKDDAGWARAITPVSGKIYNCYSKNDGTLGYLYRGANLGLSQPIGYDVITLRNAKIRNINCSRIVNGHMDWKGQFGKILKKSIASRHAPAMR